MRKQAPVILAAAIILAASTAFAASPKSEKSAKTDPQSARDADGWISLFNGKNLDGWKLSKDNPDTFKIVDGQIVAKGKVCHLYYAGKVNDANFKNFQWKCEVMTKPNSNSGMYFHTKYQDSGFPTTGIECQVNNSHGDPRRTGSLYRLKDVMNDSPAKDNEWFTQEVIVKGPHITVKVNDKTVNEFDWPENFKREAGFKDNLLGSGTFALQGHDPGSEVHYRKIMVKPLPDK
jgi:3-keto-disaccharide hydrolase